MKYLLDIHCHSISSGHAYSSVTENVEYAKKIGIKLLAITDHAPKIPGSCGNLHFLNLKVLPERFGDLELLSGVELNILDKEGNIDLPKQILEKLDVKIASLHPPCIVSMGADDNTAAVVNAMKNEHVNIIGHLGDPRYPINIDEIIKYSIDTKTLIELNNSSLNPINSRSGGEEIIIKILKECKKKSLPIVMGSDSHYHTYIGNFNYAIKLLEELDFPDELVLNTSVENFKKYINVK